jgi:glycosyltransferase involved in cell wall biosynthesis
MSRTVSVILPYYNRKELLKLTLDSFQHFYSGNPDLEVVIVDDGSNDANRVEKLCSEYNLKLQLVRIENKTGINPCYPYNVGVRKSTGDTVVLSSPETLHTTNMFEISDNFRNLNDRTYLQFSVFCLTDEISKGVISSNAWFYNKLDFINGQKPLFYENLGERGYSFNNSYGSWYTHSKIRPSCLNFFSALTRDNYYKLSGFDERFRSGTEYDDVEFRDRVLKLVDHIVWVDDAAAIHVDHELVGSQGPTTNENLFNCTRKVDCYSHNNLWGTLKD